MESTLCSSFTTNALSGFTEIYQYAKAKEKNSHLKLLSDHHKMHYKKKQSIKY